MFLHSTCRHPDPLIVWWAASLLFLFTFSASACTAASPVASTPISPIPFTSTASPNPLDKPTSQAIPSPTSSPLPNAVDTPAPPPSPTAAPPDCWSSGGHFEPGIVESSLLRQPLEFRVYLPPCYAEQPEQSYPVLYLIHGQSFTDDQWERLGAGQLAGELAATGQLPPFLIVMPRDQLWLEPTSDLFGQALVEVLLPWMEANYRTLPEPQYRAVGGLSRGGAWALHLGLTHPELFGAVGMHSGFAFHSDVPYIRRWLEAIPPEQMPRFFIDIGDSDRLEISASSTWFEGLLTSYNIPHEWHIFTGYHEETYWQAHTAQYLHWYAEEWAQVP